MPALAEDIKTVYIRLIDCANVYNKLHNQHSLSLSLSEPFGHRNASYVVVVSLADAGGGDGFKFSSVGVVVL